MALSDQSHLNPPRRALHRQTDHTNNRIHAIWLQNLPILRARLDQLAAAATAAKTQTLSATDRQEAISIAHKLAGSLGMFGFPEGSVLALQLETAFQATESQPEMLAQLAAQLRVTLRLAA